MTEHDFERTARAWLNDGPSTMSDRPLEAALAEIHATPQRRASWPARRFPEMFNLTRFAAVAASLAVAVVIGSALLPGSGFGTAPPTASPSPSPTPMLLAFRQDSDAETALEPGTYVTDPVFGVPVAFTVPAGWRGKIGGPFLAYVSSTAGPVISFELVDDVYADPCQPSEGMLDPRPGPGVDDLVDALRSMPGVTVSDVVDVSVDGYAGKQLTLTAPDTMRGCDLAGSYSIWQLPLGSVKSMIASETTVIRVLDVDGERLVIDVPDRASYTDDHRAQAAAIVDSIRLGPDN